MMMMTMVRLLALTRLMKKASSTSRLLQQQRQRRWPLKADRVSAFCGHSLPYVRILDYTISKGRSLGYLLRFMTKISPKPIHMISGAYVSPLLHSFDQLEAKYSAKDDVGGLKQLKEKWNQPFRERLMRWAELQREMEEEEGAEHRLWLMMLMIVDEDGMIHIASLPFSKFRTLWIWYQSHGYF